MNPFLSLTPLVFLVAALNAQSPATLAGSWRADLPLPNGTVQTFRFAADGKFELSMTLAVDGQYEVQGGRLIQTIALPGMVTSKTDTSSMRLTADSLVVSDGGGSAVGKALHRVSAVSGAPSIIGDWAITLGGGMSASYRFDANGGMHITAQVSDERGTYTISGTNLRLTDDKMFEIPATTTFTVTDTLLTLTPPNGKGARTFHKLPG